MNITLFFEYLKLENLEKDPFLVPYYLGKEMGSEVTILYSRFSENENLPTEYKGVKLIPFKVYGTWTTSPWIRYIHIYKYIIKNAKKIDIFMRFFMGRKSEISVMIYKLFNPHGKVYVKLDIDPYSIYNGNENRNFFLRFLKRMWYQYYIKQVDVVSCETTEAQKRISRSNEPQYQFGDKLMIVPNGVNETAIEEMGFGNTAYANKENCMITIGRLGTYQKNTEMLLAALGKVDMKDWKFYFVGSVENEFQKDIDNFYSLHPDKKERVIFTGMITDRQKLYEYLNRSKVFILSSRFESFAIVLAEAKRFMNYIVSTPVGAIYDVIENGKYGEIIAHDDIDGLSKVMQYIIDGKKNIDVYGDFDYKSLAWENQLKNVVEKLRIK